MNFILIIIEIIVAYFFLLLFYKKYKQNGLYIYSTLLYILSILLSVKSIEIMTMDIPLGIVLTTINYAIANILVQKNGLPATTKQILILLASGVLTILVIILSIVIEPSTYNSILNTSYSSLFLDKLRIILTTALVPILLLWLNSIMYYQLKRDKNNIFISNILSLLIIYFIDAAIYAFIAFIFVLPLNKIFIIIAIIYTIKIITGLLGIPAVYKARNIKDK